MSMATDIVRGMAQVLHRVRRRAGQAFGRRQAPARQPSGTGTPPKHVWFVNHHAAIPTKDGGAARHLNMARHLEEHGWNASLVVASTTHPDGRQRMPGWKIRLLTTELGVPTLWVRGLSYRTMPRRLAGMLLFSGLLVAPGTTRGLRAPDVIVGSTVHPFAAAAAYLHARRRGIPFIFEVRDVWPETLIEFGKLAPRHPLALVLRRLSVLLCTRAAAVVSPLPSLDTYLTEIGLPDKRFEWISNGTEGLTERPAPHLPVPGSTFTFMYLGSHGYANAVDHILDAFDLATQLRPDLDLRLRLIGSGNLRERLIEHATKLQSAGVITFEPSVPGDEVIRVGREADAMVLAVRDLNVYRFGISMNKIFTYMQCYRPTVMSSSAPRNPVVECAAGLVTPAEDKVGLAKAFIRMATSDHGQRAAWARHGYRSATREFSYPYLARKLTTLLDEVTQEPR